MTITRYDRFAIVPKRCNKCYRLFWLEGYNTDSSIFGNQVVELIKCKECIHNENKCVNTSDVRGDAE